MRLADFVDYTAVVGVEFQILPVAGLPKTGMKSGRELVMHASLYTILPCQRLIPLASCTKNFVVISSR